MLVALASIAASPVAAVYEFLVGLLMLLVGIIGGRAFGRVRPKEGVLVSMGLALLVGPAVYVAVWLIGDAVGQ